MEVKRSIISIAMATIMLLSLSAVCASTSVSAAQGSSRAGAHATPSLVGAPIAAGTGPSACVLNGSTSMYVSVKGYDGALWYRIWDTSTHTWAGGWNSLGGYLTSSPAAASRQAGAIDVYVAGTNGHVYERPYYNGVWHDWVNIGGTVAPGTGPAASGWPGREEVFVAGTNGALYQKTWTGTWSGWTNLGGKLTSSPAAATTSDSNIYVAARGTTGTLYDRWSSNGGLGWTDWYNWGGQILAGTGPAALSPSFLNINYFVAGTNSQLYVWSGGDWAPVGGKLTSSPTAATFTYNGTKYIEAFVRGTNGLIYQTEWYDGWWHGWSPGVQGPP